MEKSRNGCREVDMPYLNFTATLTQESLKNPSQKSTLERDSCRYLLGKPSPPCKVWKMFVDKEVTRVLEEHQQI